MRLLLALCLLALLPSASAAEVYRCVTGNGVVRYSDKPCNDGKVDKLAIESRPTDPDAVKAETEARKEKIAELDKADAEAAKAASEAAALAEKRKQQCIAARERLQKLETHRKITEGEGENKRYLESDEIVQRRQEAQDKVNELCSD